ncbi:zinc-binding dehydrogenase [Dactylosporangium sp. AC04546]|uniref:zinc-binding dehydrogenase n=1 Tax=Dactylosporangium sp. AC04546 TaxID=2862460 RepID=UPI001EE11001|nr:zinc-binding dehydrogenase [Dactylosporangium sp. AC04546]WVK88891.1 zinc-binding dehydrogenase [Dactylosporangium sp. AC04546]
MSQANTAIVYTEFGDSSVLREVDRVVAEPGPGEIRVRMVVSGVNPTDWKQRTGATATSDIPAEGAVPNQDGSGIVDAVGAGVSGFAPGDRVWLMLAAYQRPGSGTAQQYTVVPADRVVPLPDGVGFEAGASVGVPAMTAHRALTVHDGAPARLAPGALDGVNVLVAGGAGAVGNAAIQLARWAGASVVATVSGPEKAALARAAGAERVVNYREPGAAAQIRDAFGDGVDVVVEVAAAHNAELDLAVLRPGGTIAVYADDGSGRPLTVDVRRHMVLNVRYQFVLLYTVGRDALANGAAAVNAALAGGGLRFGADAGVPLHTFPLAETAAAHAAVEAGAIGKVLIRVDPSSIG